MSSVEGHRIINLMFRLKRMIKTLLAIGHFQESHTTRNMGFNNEWKRQKKKFGHCKRCGGNFVNKRKMLDFRRLSHPFYFVFSSTFLASNDTISYGLFLATLYIKEERKTWSNGSRNSINNIQNINVLIINQVFKPVSSKKNKYQINIIRIKLQTPHKTLDS